MPDERTGAGTAGDDTPPGADGWPAERDGYPGAGPHRSDVDAASQEAASEPVRGSDVRPPIIDRGSTRAVDLPSAGPGTEDGAGRFVPAAPVLPPQPGWAPQRTVRARESESGAAIGSDLPRFESPPLVPPVPSGADDGLPVIGEHEPTEEERAAAEAEASARKRQRTKTLVREVVETVLLALLVFLAVRASFQNFKVEGNSMFPTLDDGEFLIVNKLVYSEVDVDKLSRFIPFLDAGDNPRRWVFHGPERGDIVVLQDPRDPSVDLIKRVIGLPGDQFEIIQGKVFINGFLLEEPYIKSPWRGSLPETTIPPGEYFVMGDNRDNSQDSRSLGLVPKDLIIGKALLAYWPLSDFGTAPNESPTVTGKSVMDVYGASPPRAVAGTR